MQKNLQAEVAKRSELHHELPYTDDIISDICTAIIHEAVELQDLTDWKWWKNYIEFNKEKAKEELVDILHFVIHAAIELDMTPADLHDQYKQKHKVNIQRQKDGY